jgi:hypothetical protein
MLQILHRCCFIFLELEGADADMRLLLTIYNVIIVKFYVPNSEMKRTMLNH